MQSSHGFREGARHRLAEERHLAEGRSWSELSEHELAGIGREPVDAHGAGLQEEERLAGLAGRVDELSGAGGGHGQAVRDLVHLVRGETLEEIVLAQQGVSQASDFGRDAPHLAKLAATSKLTQEAHQGRSLRGRKER